MHVRSILALATVAVGITAGLAHAQPQERRDHDQRQPQQQQPPHSRDAHPPARNAGPQHAQGHRPTAARPAAQHDRGRGVGPDHRFHRGDRMPPDLRGNQYVVDDWRGHRLSPPPRGHRWVQVGADYALVAIATGVIAQIILSQ